jgi:hypothetical protein
MTPRERPEPTDRAAAVGRPDCDRGGGDAELDQEREGLVVVVAPQCKPDAAADQRPDPAAHDGGEDAEALLAGHEQPAERAEDEAEHGGADHPPQCSANRAEDDEQQDDREKDPEDDHGLSLEPES